MSKFIFTDKHISLLKKCFDDETRKVFLEGTSRSTKSFFLTMCAYHLISNSPDWLHCLAAKDGDAIADIFLESDYGLLTAYEGCILKKGKLGGFYLLIPNKNPNFKGDYKKVLLAPHGNASKWKKILGKGLGVVIATEINIADLNFLQEVDSRQEAAEKPIFIGDLNGDAPDHEVYQQMINYATMIGKVPNETRALMEEFQKEKGTKPGWFYTHWTRHDNPIFTKEKIQRSLDQYVEGSFRYFSKGRGLRVAPEGSIFADYLIPLKKPEELFHIIGFDDQKGYKRDTIDEFVSVDIGIDYDKDVKVFTITGKLRDGRLVIIDYKEIIGDIDIDTLDVEFKKFALYWKKLFDYKLRHVYYDHNEFTATKTLKDRNKGFRWKQAEKQGKYGLESRKDNLEVLFNNKQLIFTKQSKPLIDHFSKLVHDKSGRKWCKDNLSSKKATHYIDSMFYSLCRVWSKLVIR